MPEMQQACVEVDIGLGESQKLSGSQAGKIQKAQGSAQDCAPNRRCPSFRQLSASLQKTLTLVSAEHPWHKFLAHDPQGAAVWHDRPGVFETQEATDFPHECHRKYATYSRAAVEFPRRLLFSPLTHR